MCANLQTSLIKRCYHALSGIFFFFFLKKSTAFWLNLHCKVQIAFKLGLAHLGKGEYRWCKWAQTWAVRCFGAGGR